MKSLRGKTNGQARMDSGPFGKTARGRATTRAQHAFCQPTA